MDSTHDTASAVAVSDKVCRSFLSPVGPKDILETSRKESSVGALTEESRNA